VLEANGCPQVGGLRTAAQPTQGNRLAPQVDCLIVGCCLG